MKLTLYVPDDSIEDLEKFRVILKLFNVSLSAWLMKEVKEHMRRAKHAESLLRMLRFNGRMK